MVDHHVLQAPCPQEPAGLWLGVGHRTQRHVQAGRG